MSFLKEFKEFAMRGNVFDMAVGVVIGSTFTAIVNSLVGNIIMPLVSVITGGYDIASLGVELAPAVGEKPAVVLGYGAFLSAIVDFLLVAFVLFLFVKGMNKLREKSHKKEEPAPAPAPKRVCPFCKMEIADDATRCPHCTSVLE
ncbi:MAG: large-conductance mechanosensitive channel protein MscL [Christensenellaceae bacterium]|nr:large-conductance mechanosensitive channel protein MscL [Christensenellaceae bacterium]